MRKFPSPPNLKYRPGIALFHAIACVLLMQHQCSPPSAIFSTSPGDNRHAAVPDLEAGKGGGGRTNSIALYFSLQGWPAQCLTHSLWDLLDNSVLEMRLNRK